MKRLAILTLLGCTTFLVAFLVRARHETDGPLRPPLPGVEAPDSVHLAALGVRPGPQLVAYVFGGSGCGYCQAPEVKQAFMSLRHALTARYVSSGRYSSVRIVGVAINTDIREGLGYLESIGSNLFDEVSVGSGWQNEHVIRLIHQQRLAEPAAPLVVVVSRPLAATLAPLRLTYGEDSVLKVVWGASGISAWVRAGANLSDLAVSPSGTSAIGTSWNLPSP